MLRPANQGYSRSVSPCQEKENESQRLDSLKDERDPLEGGRWRWCPNLEESRLQVYNVSSRPALK